MWKSAAEESDLKDTGFPDNWVSRGQVPLLRGPDIFPVTSSLMTSEENLDGLVEVSHGPHQLMCRCMGRDERQ